ncbi:MAG: hypothetical protein MI755_18345, partial [Sphingomonadales bacterium]|nr:hypothetical protein [Sphingomonadales bacterium]
KSKPETLHRNWLHYRGRVIRKRACFFGECRLVGIRKDFNSVVRSVAIRMEYLKTNRRKYQFFVGGEVESYAWKPPDRVAKGPRQLSLP